MGISQSELIKKKSSIQFMTVILLLVFQTILLTNLGFGRAFVLQDHVAATFGAGLGKPTNVQLHCKSCAQYYQLYIIYVHGFLLQRIYICTPNDPT